VAAPSLSESELKFLRALARRQVRFIIVGLSAAALQGAPVVTQDVDLWFEDLSDPKIREALDEIGGAYVPPIEMNPPMFAGGGLELFDIVLRMDGLGKFADEWTNCTEVSVGGAPLRVLLMERILTSKRATDRPKDRLVVPVLEDSVRAHRETKKKHRRSPNRPGNEDE
jgi:hypothetical protein